MTVFFVVFGASGDLAQRKTFPAILSLKIYKNLLEDIKIVGFSRSKLSTAEFHERLTKFSSVPSDHLFDMQAILRNSDYIAGNYDAAEDYVRLKHKLQQMSIDVQKDQIIYYLALPPTVFSSVSQNIHEHLAEYTNFKVVIEKPFGTDLHSSAVLNQQLANLFPESKIFRIDHYLGKEMVRNMFTLRFCNLFFSALWNNRHISNVQITFKETIGVENRAGYFDEAGIVRDVLQNHLLQILSIVAMEPPVSLDPREIRNEKVKVLKCIGRNISESDVVFGQYTASPSHVGYLNENGIATASQTPTFATVVLFVNNERYACFDFIMRLKRHMHLCRWEGVPFTLKCGKGLNESKAEVRIQLRDTPASLRYFGGAEEIIRNELVIRVQPKEAVYLKLVLKKPGMFELETEVAELDLSYNKRFSASRIPDAYERLLLDVVRGDQSTFVRSDELEEAWKIADPIVRLSERASLHTYEFGSRGPEASDELIRSIGLFRRQERAYNWPKL